MRINGAIIECSVANTCMHGISKLKVSIKWYTNKQKCSLILNMTLITCNFIEMQSFNCQLAIYAYHNYPWTSLHATIR